MQIFDLVKMQIFSSGQKTVKKSTGTGILNNSLFYNTVVDAIEKAKIFFKTIPQL